jgi:cobalt-zinc-cadmium efflux system protein
VVLATVTVVEVVAGFATRSLALLSDAGHMLTDVTGLGMALAAIHVADRSTDRRQRTFGLYRLEILAALVNAVLLFGVATYVLVEALRRWDDPPDVLAGPMLVVAVLGLVANLVAFVLLRAGSKESLNIEGAYLEVLSDLLGSFGVIVAAIVLGTTGWEWVDPVVGVAIGVFILPRAWRLGAQAVRVLVQAAPPGLDVAAIMADLHAIDGVVDVHDLHVWTLTSEMEVASVHLMVREGTDAHGVLDQARDVLRDGFGIGHATLQVEPDTHEGCDELAW